MTQDDLDFSRLFHQSQQLNAKVSGSRNIPTIYRGLEQLEAFSTKLAAKAGIISGELNDIRYSELEKINFLHTGLETQVNAVGTDVAGYLQSEYEKKIVSSIEKIQKDTNKKINDMIKNKLASEWERRKKTLIEEGHYEGGSTISTTGSLSSAAISEKTSNVGMYTGPKFTTYLNVIKKLNDSRLKGSKMPLAKAFASELRGLDRELRSDQILACWDAISIIECEEEGFDQVNLSNSYRAPIGSSNRSQWSKSLVSGSKKFLETSFSKYIDNTISYFPRDAQLGGKPSSIDRIKTFLHIRMKRGSPNEIQKMDLIDGTPVWACIFYLFRSGYLREAYHFASQYEFHFLKSEPNFIAYLKAFIETEDNFLTGTLKAQIQSDYSQRLIVGNQDPFKMTLLKILGRCDLSKKTVPEVITTTQDYIWLQLWLVKEGQDSSSASSPYNLASLQKMVLDFGPKHFNPKNNNPVQYFETLLIVGLFEDAVAYLFESPHQLDAIHFAITLFYHGTINAVPNPTSSDWETVVSLKEPGVSQATTRCLNYFKLISTISKTFSPADVIDAVQYYSTLPLALHGYNTICQDSIRDIILASGSLSAILGDTAADGSHRPGIISRFAPLMSSNGNIGHNLEEQRRFMHNLTKSAAAKCEKDDKFIDAVHLYNLTGDYDKVLQIICRKMSQTISQAYVAPTQATIYSSAKSVYQFYTSMQELSMKVQPRSLETCKTLLDLLEFKKLFSECQWRSAVQRIEEIGLFYLSSSQINDDSGVELDNVSAAVERFKSLDDTITCNLSDVLLATMTSIYQIFQESKSFVNQDMGRQQEVHKLRRKSRNLMILVGMLQYRVSQEVCAKMTRMDIFMN